MSALLLEELLEIVPASPVPAPLGKCPERQVQILHRLGSLGIVVLEGIAPMEVVEPLRPFLGVDTLVPA